MDGTTMLDDAEVEPGSQSGSPNTSTPSHTNKPKGGVIPSGAMPTTKGGGLSNVANEFWFPESRNCPCCKGYKHGCKCRVGSVQVCTHQGCTTTISNIEEEVKLEPTKPRHKPKIVFKTATQPAPAPSPAPSAAPVQTSSSSTTTEAARAFTSANPTAPSSGTPCTYFNTPEGCRFGNTCRFSHIPSSQGPNGSQGGNNVSVASGLPSTQPCMFFKQGSCRNGAQCRFSHEM